ncbi:MAG: EFR1 family ferrodoxin [Bacillota bacterium]|nr:EFR1 family ferrodoxin [Bacillota bacterium]
MELHRARLIYFSPNGTTKSVLDAVVKGIGAEEVTLVDSTRPEVRSEKQGPITEDLVIIGVPVYFGRIPQAAYDYLINLQGNQKPVVIMSVFGNRGYGDSLLELKEICRQAGFHVIAAAAFIGEHAFSTDKIAIAINRPDEDDLRKAEAFGQQIRQKIVSCTKTEELTEPNVLGNPMLKKRPKDLFSCVSQRDIQVCTQCGLCAKNCPVGAIDTETLAVNKDLCIHCCACVKGCPQNARTMKNTKFKMVSIMLEKTCKTRQEPIIF